MNRLKTFLIVVAAIAVTGCSGLSVQDYAQNQPNLIMHEFFKGDLKAHGVVKDFRGKVIRRFNVEIIAYWTDGVGTLEEDFIFDNGDLERRVWTLEPSDNGGYNGSAGDVVGTGDVTIAGNSAFLDYVLRIPYNDGTLDVRVDDRMYLVSPTVLINESRMSKFGFKVGEILLVIEKLQ